MSSPLVLSDLPVATVALNTDIVLLRSGLTDYQCSVALIRNINIQALSVLPGQGSIAANTDKFLISRIVSGNPQNFQIQFSQVGFIAGTVMWFSSDTPPIGWTPVPNTGDALLAVSDGTNQYAGANGGTIAGLWQQEGVGGGTGGLTKAQIPAHTHGIVMGNNSGGPNVGYVETAQTKLGFNFDLATSDGSAGGLQGATHNHGEAWRPLANIGCLGIKSS